MSSKNFYGLTGDVTVDGGILNVGNAQLYANTETSNVGVGTSNPEFQLDVHGDANVGVLYSTFLHGDGSNIENIVSSQWEGSPGDPIYYASNVGIANTSPFTKTLQVGSNLYVEDAGSNVLHVTGNVYADYFVGDGSQLTGIAASLDQIVDQGNTVSNTIQIISGQDATSNIGLVTHEGVSISVSNANPTGEYQFGVGSNLLVNVYSSNVLTVDGNVFAQKMTLGTVTITPAYNLQQIMATGATSDQTLVLSNVTTGLMTTSNVGIANTAPVHTLDVGSNLYVEDTGSNVLTVTGNVSVSNLQVTERLDVGSNVHIENLRVAEVAANLVTYDSSTGELMDSAGLFSNKLAVVSEQPPVALTGASTLVAKHGTYTIETSSTATGSEVYHLFDKNSSTVWQTDDDPLNEYDSNDGSYDGSANLTGEDNLTGEWAKITMPYKTILRHVEIESINSSIKDVTIVGLNADGLTWSVLKTVNGLNEEISTIIVNATTHHRTYGLIVRATNIGSSQAEISDLKLFTESFSIDGGKVEMATSMVMGGETTMDQHGPHGRDPTTPLLKKFPEIIFDASKYYQNHSTNTYVQAGYTVSASSQTNDDKNAAKLYEDNFPVTGQNETWQTVNGTYDDNTGDATSGYALTGITGGVGSRNGSYTTLELPHKIKLSYIQIQTRNSDFENPINPKQIYLYGSNDGSSWTQVGSHIFTSIPTSPVWQRIDINSTTPYNYFVLQVTSVLDTQTRTSICQLRYYGYEELATEGDTSIDTTFTSIMNTPQTTGANVYIDGNLGETLTNRVTGPDATGTSATYDETGKYWELNGTLTSNIAVEANTFLEGDQPHSVSVWFNSSNLEANVSNTCVFSISDQEKLDSLNLDLQSNTWHNLTYAYQGEGGSRVTYLDGRKVAEDQAEDTFGEYPPFAMTGYSQSGYVASASSEYASIYQQWEQYGEGGTDAGNSWISGPTQNYFGTGAGATGEAYTSGGNVADTTVIDGVTTYGEWNQVEFSEKLHLSSVALNGINSVDAARYPKDAIVCASIDGITWTSIGSWTGEVNRAEANIKHYILNSTKAFKYVRIVVTKISTGYDGLTMLSRVRYYGHRENDLVRLPDPTNVLKYPHIAMTGPAQRGYVASASTTYSLYEPWEAFNGVTDAGGNNYWSGANSLYSTSTPFNFTGSGDPYETSVSGTTYTGEWLQIELPHRIRVDHVLFNVVATARFPRQGVYAGSNDGSTWFELHTFSGLTTTDEETRVPSSGSFNGSSASNAYKYIRLIITHNNSNPYASCDELKIFGTGVDSVPIQIGGGNIDKVANFRVYDKFVGEDQALEIWDAQKDEFGRAKSSMTLHKGRLGIGTTEPEGRLAVLDEPNGLEEFPPRAMTDYETYFEGHGVFRVSASDQFDEYGTYAPWKAFTKNTTSYYITDYPSSYNSDGTPIGISTFEGVSGSWLKLKLPYDILLKRINIARRFDFGEHFRTALLYGSVDDVSWDVLHNIQMPTAYTNVDFEINATKVYKYFVVQITEGGGLTYKNIGEWKLFGTREQGQSVLHDGQLTLTKNLNVPRIGPALDADDTPRRDRLVVEYNTSTNPTFEGAVRDTSGRGFHGALFGGAYYDATEKALVFDGTDDYITTRIHNQPGDWIHSISFWVKFTNLTGVDTEAPFQIGPGTGAATSKYSALDWSSAELNWYFFSNDLNTSYALGTGASKWIHFACVYEGGGATSSRHIYLDGINISSYYSNSPINPLDFNSNQVLTLGRDSDRASTDPSYFHGFISNFKLYDTALTAQEVKTLYDMGRLSNVIHKPLQIKADVKVTGSLQIPTDRGDAGTLGMLMFNTEIGKLQVHNGSAWVTLGGVSAAGGTIDITYADGYTIHTLTSSGTFTVYSGGDIEYLVVAGGGGGGYQHGAGGGAGGLLTGTLSGVASGSYTITVGAGGTGGTTGTGGNGTASSITSLVTTVGGGGGGRGYAPTGSGQAGENGNSGGSGGGGGPFHVGGAGTAGQGNSGGNGIYDGGLVAGHGGGGGGAGGAGGNGLFNGSINEGISGKGGIGLASSITGTSVTYAGGGSGGRWGGTNAIDVLGGVGSTNGGGGLGGALNNVPSYVAGAGQVNTGGGGGGGGDGGGLGGAGGSGIVIIRYI